MGHVFTEAASVWFTLTEMEISINRKILIPLMEMKTETKKFDTETDKFGYVRFRFHCISVSSEH